MTDHSRPVPRSSSFKWLLPVAAASMLGLAGCPSPVDWSDYEGMNLIAERGFGANVGGSVVWEQRDGTDGYLVWENATSESSYPGVPAALSGSRVYRLEMKNILANGDFENVDAGDLPAGWQGVGATNAEVITAADFNARDRANDVDLLPLHGNKVLLLDYESPEERFFLDLTDGAALTVPPAEIVAEGRALALFLDFRTPVDFFPISLNDEPTDTDIQNQILISRGETNNDQITYRYPGQDRSAEVAAIGDPGRNQLAVIDTNYSAFSIGGFTSRTENRTDAVIDNIRLTRNDLNHAVFLQVPYTEPLDPDRPKIVGGGSYSVRFWVAQDATAGSDNRFTPRYMRVALAYPENQAAFATREVFLEDASVVEQWGSGWSQVEVELSGPRMSSFDPDPIAFELEIGLGSSGNSAKQYPGSLMIAAPELVFSPH